MNQARTRRPYRVVKKKYDDQQNSCILKQVKKNHKKICIVFLIFFMTIAMLKGFILCKLTSK